MRKETSQVTSKKQVWQNVLQFKQTISVNKRSPFFQSINWCKKFHLPLRSLPRTFIFLLKRGVMLWHGSPFFLYFSIIDFKTLILWLEVRTRFKALHNGSNRNTSVMETVIHLVIECKSVYYIAYGLEISLNKTKQHLSHWPIIVMRLELTGLKIHEGI